MYENKIVIENVSIEKNRINYHYTISGEWLDCFKEDEQFYIEYSIVVSSIPNLYCSSASTCKSVTDGLDL